MNSPATPSSAPKPASLLRFLGHFLLRPGVIIVAVIIALPVLFYSEENWRGKRAWEDCKRQMEAKGAVLDWSAYIPPFVPEDQNFFAAPNMARWFVGRGNNDLSSRLSFGNFQSFLRDRHSNTLAEVTIVPLDAAISPGDADIIMDYNPPLLSLASPQPDPVRNSAPTNVILPLVVMDEVPLMDVIKNLARQENLNYKLDPNLPYGRPQADGTIAPQPNVSFRWTNITAHRALLAVLANYNLQLIPIPKTGVARIANHPANTPSVQLDADANAQFTKLLLDAIAVPTNRISGPWTISPLSLTLVGSPPQAGKPVRVFVRAASVPDDRAVAYFFPAKSFPMSGYSPSSVFAESESSNSFRVFLDAAPYFNAADFLEWSDQFADDFAAIREALQRPYARMDGDYSQPHTLPIPNFVCVRIVAQTLAARVQCHLLLNHPESALRDLTLLHQLTRLLESRPAGKPMTLVAAMINVAVTGLYVSTVADGLRLQVWREPELAAIQKQLGEIDLPPLVLAAFKFEQVSGCSHLETAVIAQAEFVRMMSSGNPAPNEWQQLKDPIYLFIRFAPRGWIFQNMAVVTGLHQNVIDAFDLTNKIIRPEQIDAAWMTAGATVRRPSPYVTLASILVANFSRAVQTLAHNQTLVNEAFVVCALERHRLAHGQYPETLAALVPQFADKIPNDLIDGRPLIYRRVDQKFLLYSVGWNRRDDGGVTPPASGNMPSLTDGDWVWPYRECQFK